MLLAILKDGRKVRKGQLTTCFGLDPHVGPFSLACVVKHQPTEMSAYSWSSGGEQFIAVTIESAREDYGVDVPSRIINAAKQFGKAP